MKPISSLITNLICLLPLFFSKFNPWAIDPCRRYELYFIRSSSIDFLEFAITCRGRKNISCFTNENQMYFQGGGWLHILILSGILNIVHFHQKKKNLSSTIQILEDLKWHPHTYIVFQKNCWLSNHTSFLSGSPNFQFTATIISRMNSIFSEL